MEPRRVLFTRRWPGDTAAENVRAVAEGWRPPNTVAGLAA